MHHQEYLDAELLDRLEFVTARPPGSPFATLDRQVVITGPPELIALAQIGDVALLDALIECLREPARHAWPAQVILAALTGREQKIVDIYAAVPESWWAALGETAYRRWSGWLAEARERLTWDAASNTFVEQPQRAE